MRDASKFTRVSNGAPRRNLSAAAFFGSIAVIGLVASFGPTCVEETEFNNSVSSADLLRRGEIAMGARTGGDVDYWRIVPVSRNDLGFIYVTAEDSTLTTDTIIHVLANDGTLLEEDDDDGPDDSSAIAGVAATQEGSFVLRVTSPIGGNISEYEIFHAVIDPNHSAPEIEDNDTPNNATIISAPMMTGDIDNLPSRDWYQFRAVGGTRLVVIVDNEFDGPGFTSLSFSVRSESLNESVIESEVICNNCDAIAAGPGTVPSTGKYFVRFVEEGRRVWFGLSICGLAQRRAVRGRGRRPLREYG